MTRHSLRSNNASLLLGAALAIGVVLGSSFVVGPSDAHAQDVAAPRPLFRLGAEASVVIPVGDYANAADVALGGNVRFAFDVLPNVGLTLRTGYLHHLGTPSDASIGFVPIMFGGEYRFFADGPTPFVLAELGVTIAFATVNTGFGRSSDSDSSLGLAIGGGYRFGAFDVRAMLYAPDADDLVGFQIAIGGDFLSF